MRHTHRILLFLFCLAPFCTYAQDIKGIVFKEKSSTRIAQALVTNLRTKVIMMSDELGIFTIKAQPGDTLFFTKGEHTPAKQVVINAGDMLVYMSKAPAIELDEVKIKGQTKQQELTDVMKSYRAQGTLFNGKPPALIFLTSPITGLYELFGRIPRQAAHFAKFTKAELQQSEINKRYNKEFVKRVTGLTTDEETLKFMDRYSPSYEDITAWNDYELVKRTKRWYNFYKKGEAPVAPLIKP